MGLKASAAIFPDLAADCASGGYVEDWQDLETRGFIEQSIPEEEEDFLMTSWSGPSKHLHHQPVSPDRTRSLSLENELPVSFLIRSSALEDLTAVGDKLRESLQQEPCTESSHYDEEHTVKDTPSINISLCPNGDLWVDPSCEYIQGSTTPTQDTLQAQGHGLNSVSVTDSFLVAHEDNQSDLVEESLETEGKEDVLPLKDSNGSPVTSYGSSSRKSRVPVSQFKGL